MVALNYNQEELQPPTPDVIAWCENLVRVTADGGVWGIPRSGTTFRIDKKTKRLVLIISGKDDDADFLATKHNFAFIGWDVVKEHGSNNAEENV